MTTKPDDPAYPCSKIKGLTKREYFAAMAMTGYLASVPTDTIERPEYAASHAVQYADALINELNKEK